MLSTILLVTLAAICNACMDTLVHHHSLSLFRDLELKYGLFWSDATTTSWKNKYIDGDPAKGRIKIKVFGIEINKPEFLTDAWHAFKSLMILILCVAILSFKSSIGIIFGLVILGCVWNLVFSLFYNKVLVKK